MLSRETAVFAFRPFAYLEVFDAKANIQSKLELHTPERRRWNNCSGRDSLFVPPWRTYANPGTAECFQSLERETMTRFKVRPNDAGVLVALLLKNMLGLKPGRFSPRSGKEAVCPDRE